MPVFLSDVPGLFATRRIPLDVALVSLSPPDEHGLCTLGTSIDAAKAATEHATIILAEINEQLPRTYGATVVPFERVTAFVHTDRPLHEAHSRSRSARWRTRSASTSRTWSRTARRCRWASAPSPTRC